MVSLVMKEWNLVNIYIIILNKKVDKNLINFLFYIKYGCVFLYFYINIMKQREDYNDISTKEKQPGYKEAWEWLSQVVKWTCDSLFNVLSATWTGMLAWTEKLSQVLWSKDENIRANKQEIINHRLNQSKKSLKMAWKWAVDIVKWWIKTAKWTVRTIISSGKEVLKWLREDDKLKNSDKDKI